MFRRHVPVFSVQEVGSGTKLRNKISQLRLVPEQMIPNSVVSTGRSSGSAAVFVKKSRRLTDKVSSRLQLAIDLEIEMIAPAAPLTAGGTLQAARCKRLSARGKP